MVPSFGSCLFLAFDQYSNPDRPPHPHFCTVSPTLDF